MVFTAIQVIALIIFYNCFKFSLEHLKLFWDKLLYESYHD